MFNVKTYIVFILLFTVVLRSESAALKVRVPIDRAINKVLRKAKARFGGKKKKGKPEKEKEKEEENQKGKLKPETFTMAGAKHTLTFEKGEVYMASVKGKLLTKLYKAKKEVEGNPEAENLDGKAEHIISSLGGLSKAVTGTTKNLKSALKSKKADKISKAQKSLDKLANNIGKFGTKYGLKDLVDVSSDDTENKGLKRIKRKTLFFREISVPDTNHKIILTSQTAEYRRQMKNQEHAINQMTVEVWKTRRDTFIAKQTGADNNSKIRRRIKADIIALLKSRYYETLLAKYNDKRHVLEMIKKYAGRLVDGNYVRILHNPDRVAGGKPEVKYVKGDFALDTDAKTAVSVAFRQIPVIGGERANGMLGEQWKNGPSGSLGNAVILTNHVQPIYAAASAEDKKKLQMSVTMKVK